MDKALILILSVFLVSCGKEINDNDSGTISFSDELSSDTFAVNQDYLTLINNYRVSKGLRPLTYSPQIEEVSFGHSKGMAQKTRPFGHWGFSSRCSRLNRTIGPTAACGEIVAKGQKSLKAVFNSWLESPEHLEEIENPYYTHTAIAFHRDITGVVYWTEMFVDIN